MVSGEDVPFFVKPLIITTSDRIDSPDPPIDAGRCILQRPLKRFHLETSGRSDGDGTMVTMGLDRKGIHSRCYE